MRKGAAVFLIVVAIVGVCGYLGDNALRGRLENQAAAALQVRLGLAQKPEVSLGGFPFALALLTNSVPSARASAARVPLTVRGQDVALTGVRVATGRLTLAGRQLHLEDAEVTGVLGYGDLAAIAGVPVSYAGNGRLGLTYTVVVAGQQYAIGLTAVPALDADAGVIRLTKPKLDEDSSAVPISGTQLARVARAIPVELPAGAKLTAVTPSEGAVAVAVEVSDASLPLG